MAALDRQHPRDLFDVRLLLANEGVDDRLRCAFIIYLLSHRRPMSEVLRARPKDLSRPFAREFQGMTAEPITLKKLLETRDLLVKTMVQDMPDAHREFLISFEVGTPKWDLLPLRHIKRLPAVKWRQVNLDDLPKKKRASLVANLEVVLEAKTRLAQGSLFA